MKVQVLPVLSLLALLSTGCAQRPSTTVESFLHAIQSGDRDTAIQCVTVESRPDDSREEVRPVPELKYLVLSEEVEEDRAVVVTQLEDAEGDRVEIPFVLLREEGLWKIDLPSTAGELLARKAAQAMVFLARFSEGFVKAAPELRQALEEVGAGFGRAFEEMGNGLEKGLESVGRGLEKLR